MRSAPSKRLDYLTLTVASLLRLLENCVHLQPLVIVIIFGTIYKQVIKLKHIEILRANKEIAIILVLAFN